METPEQIFYYNTLRAFAIIDVIIGHVNHIYRSVTTPTHTDGIKENIIWKDDYIPKQMQLQNVFFTHNSCECFIIPQSRIQPAFPNNVCADSIFKLAFTICVKQDSICQDF